MRFRAPWSTRAIGLGGISALPPNAYSDYLTSREPTARVPARPVYVDEWLTRTTVGIVFVGMELGFVVVRSLAGLIAPAGSTLGSTGFLAAIGFGAMLTVWRANTRLHRLCVVAGISLGVAAIAIYIATPILAASDGGNGYVAQAEAYRSELLSSCVTVPLALGALGMASWALQDRAGRYLLVAGMIGAVVVSVAAWWWLNPVLDAALADALANHDLSAFWGFLGQWGRIGALYALPSGVLLVAYERLYWQLHRKREAVRLARAA